MCCPSCVQLFLRDRLVRHLRKSHPSLAVKVDDLKALDLSPGGEFAECTGCYTVIRREELPAHMKKFHPPFHSRS